MITDPLFYRLFETSPETFFIVLGLLPDAAQAMAARYQYMALEFKETASRADGVFEPREAGLPMYFFEAQFYPLASVYADVMAKAFTYLKRHDPAQPFYAVVLFGSRSLEPKGLVPYQHLLNAGQLQSFFLDELPEIAEAPLGLSILYLIRQAQEQAGATARGLVFRAKKEIADEGLRRDLVELIETVILYKLPRLSREEIQTMLQVHDIRETRVYQEAKEEGIEQERLRVQGEKLASVPKLAALHVSPADIADILGLELELVLQKLAKK